MKKAGEQSCFRWLASGYPEKWYFGPKKKEATESGRRDANEAGNIDCHSSAELEAADSPGSAISIRRADCWHFDGHRHEQRRSGCHQLELFGLFPAIDMAEMKSFKMEIRTLNARPIPPSGEQGRGPARSAVRHLIWWTCWWHPATILPCPADGHQIWGWKPPYSARPDAIDRSRPFPRTMRRISCVPPPIAGSDAHDWAFLKNWPTCKQHPRWTGTECFHILKVQSSVEVKLRKKNFFKPKPSPFTGIFFKKRGNYSPDLNQSIAIQTPHTFWLQDDWTRKIDAFFSLISSWTIGLITLSSKDVEKIFSTAIEWYPRLSKSLENKQVIRWVWNGSKINLWLLS